MKLIRFGEYVEFELYVILFLMVVLFFYLFFFVGTLHIIFQGNDIIRKLQTELKSAKSKIKLKNVVTLQQEKLLDERAGLIEMQQKDLTLLKDVSGRKEEECEALKEKVEELTKKVEESRKIIEDNTHG